MSEVLDLYNKAKKEVAEIRYVIPGSGKEIYMKPFTTKDQKTILKAIESEDQILLQQAFDDVLTNCVVSKGFDVNKLFSKDRECILIELSKCSVKDEIKHEWDCEQCEKENTSLFKIENLNYTELVQDSIMQQEICFEDSDFTVRLTNTTREDEKKIIALGKKHGSKESISQTEVYNATFASVIKEFKKKIVKNIKDSDTGEIKEIVTEEFVPIKFEDRVKLFENLSISDKKKIEEFFRLLKKYGYDLIISDQQCKHCNEVQDVKLEWMNFFIM